MYVQWDSGAKSHEVDHICYQWSFRKTGKMASRVEIDVSFQASGTLAEVLGVSPPGKILRLYMQNPAI